MRVSVKSLLLAGALSASLASVAYAAGFFTNGYPLAGASPFTYTLPLTGVEQLPLDTEIPNGSPPQSEAATLSQVWQGTINTVSTATSFTATAANVSSGGYMTLVLSGAPSTAVTMTLPTATAIVNNIPNVTANYSYLLKVVNQGGTASGVWTVATGTGDTITGNATVAVAGSRQFLVTVTSVTSPAVTFEDLGN